MNNSRPHTLLVIASFFIAAAYLPQLACPLRLTGDSLNYLQISRSISAGHGFAINDKPTWYPAAYPAFIAGLDRLHIANSFALIAVNLVFLAIGTIAAFFILRRGLGLSPNAALACGNLTLLSWPAVVYVTCLLSDISFYGLSLLALWAISCLEDAQGLKRLSLAIISLALIAAAILTRVVGLALLPAFLWASLGQQRKILIQFFIATRRSRMVLAGLTMMAIIVTLVTVGCTRCGHECLGLYHQLGYRSMATLAIHFRVADLATLSTNLWQYPPLVPAAGPLFIAILCCGFWLQRSPLSSPMIYILVYLGILSVWPYYDPRFWVPITPLLAGYVWIAISRGMARWRIVRVIAPLYLGSFVALGLLALGSSMSYMSLTRDHFRALDTCEFLQSVNTQVALPENHFDALRTDTGRFYDRVHNALHNHQSLKNIADHEADHKAVQYIPAPQGAIVDHFQRETFRRIFRQKPNDTAQPL